MKDLINNTNQFYNTEIPKDWNVKQIYEIYEFINTPSFSRDNLTDIKTDREILYIHYGDIHSTYKGEILDFKLNNSIPYLKDEFYSENFNLLKDGDLVLADASEDYNGVGESIELINVGNKKVIGGLHTVVLRGINNFTANGYNTYLFRNPIVHKELKKIATGISVYGISKGNLVKLKIPLPPLPEQKAIASVLSTWDDAIHKTEQLITQKEFRKKWVMQQLLTGKKRLKGFDGEWEEVKLGDLIKLSSGDTKPNLTEKEYSEVSPFPVYGGNGIMSYSNEFNSENEKIIIGRVGEYCGITRLIAGKCWITDNALYTTDVDKSVSIHFLIYKLKYEDLSKLRSIGGQPLVSQKPIYNLSFIIPNSLKEQTAIAEVLQAADKEITLLRAKADKLREQKKGLMQMLLTGKKRLKI